jgi:hypothetical protein
MKLTERSLGRWTCPVTHAVQFADRRGENVAAGQASHPVLPPCKPSPVLRSPGSHTEGVVDSSVLVYSPSIVGRHLTAPSLDE